MKHYVGLDVSMKETFVCVVNDSGKKMYEKSVKTDPQTIASYLKGLDLDLKLIGLESGSISHWLTTELKSFDMPVKCIDARHISAVLSVNINKTDRNDARGLADAMRCGLYKEVKIKSREDIAICTLLNSRKQLVNQRVEVMGCIRGLLKTFGIRLGFLGKNLKGVEVLKASLSSLPKHAVSGIEQLLESLKALLKSIEALDKEIKGLVKETKQAQVLMSIPGIGPITALHFLAEIFDPHRFTHSKSVGAYVGMTPRQYSSGETHRQGRISKCGPKDLRSLLMEAGVVILTRTRSWSKLKAWGLKIQKKHGLKKAATAVGRKLSVMMHRMLLTNEEFKFSEEKKLAA